MLADHVGLSIDFIGFFGRTSNDCFMEAAMLGHNIGLLEPLIAPREVAHIREFFGMQIIVVLQVLFLRKDLVTNVAAKLWLLFV